MELGEASKYLTGDWTEEIKCFNCHTLVKYTQEDIVNYECMGHFGVQCSYCEFPLELSDVLPPIVLQRSWKIMSDLKFDPLGASRRKVVSWNTTCITCRSVIKFYANHVGYDIMCCPACSHEASSTKIRDIGQKFGKMENYRSRSKYTYVDAWVRHNNRPVEVVTLSPFVTNEWFIKKECTNCKSEIVITAKSETTLSDDFTLKVRCEWCNKLTLINRFKYHDDSHTPSSPCKNKLIFDHYYLSASNYNLKGEFPPVIFWKIYERQGGTYKERGGCVIS